MSNSYNLKPLSEQVIVVTGATSGIGLATCRMAVARGARVVMGARNKPLLHKLAGELRQAGGQVASCPLDVASAEGMERLAGCAIAHFGEIDSWVNNAGVSMLGRLENGSEKDHRRLFDTNFWGVVNGSLVALRYLRDQGGAILNVGSLLSEGCLPMQGMCAASKHAVKGFTDAFREEVEDLQEPVSVSLILPAFVDSPLLEHAKHHRHDDYFLPPAQFAPEDVAAAILSAASRAQPEVRVGPARSLPAARRKAKVHPDRDGLHQSISNGQVRGLGLCARTKENPLLALGALALLGVGLAFLSSSSSGAGRRPENERTTDHSVKRR